MRYDFLDNLEKKVAVVVPAYNEERLIGKTIRGIPPWVQSIIVVDDHSTDSTPSIIRNLATEDDRIYPIYQSQNQGVGAAIAVGYKEAKKIGCDVAVVMAGDNQMDPSDLETLIFPILKGFAGYVKGNRIDHPESHKMPLTRRVGSSILAKMTCIAGGLPPLNDMQCGYTALDLKYLDSIDIDHLYPSYGYPNDLILRLAVAGVPIVESTVRPVYEDEESGLSPYRVILPISKIILKGYARRMKKKAMLSKTYNKIEKVVDFYKHRSSL